MRRDIFQALADPTRRALLHLLATQSMTPNALAAHFDITRQAVSKHLRILAESRLVQSSRRGRELYYQLLPKKLSELDQWLDPFRSQWR